MSETLPLSGNRIFGRAEFSYNIGKVTSTEGHELRFAKKYN